MLRLISASVLLLLLCSCSLEQYEQRRREAVNEEARRVSQAQKAWKEKLEQTIGTHVSELLQLWGNAKSYGPGWYQWSKSETTRGGGYNETTYTAQPIYDKNHQIVGHYNAPEQRYVRPFEVTRSCEIRVDTNAQGIITQTVPAGAGCQEWFPLP